MSYKIIASDYCKETGISIVKIRTRLGDFVGIARVNSDDREQASCFTGCEIAETRAEIEYLKKKILMLNAEIKGAEIVFNSLDKENVSTKTVKKIEQMKAQKENYKKQIKSLKNMPNRILEQKAKVLKRLKEIKAKREKRQDV